MEWLVELLLAREDIDVSIKDKERLDRINGGGVQQNG